MTLPTGLTEMPSDLERRRWMRLFLSLHPAIRTAVNSAVGTSTIPHGGDSPSPPAVHEAIHEWLKDPANGHDGYPGVSDLPTTITAGQPGYLDALNTIHGWSNDQGFPTTLDMYVSPEGNDAAPGTFAAPKATLAAAFAELPSGERWVGLFNGTYRETVDVNRNDPTHLVGQSRDGVIISGAEVYASWTDEGGGVWSTTWTMNWGTADNPWPGESNPPLVFLRRELVFADDTLLTQIIEGTTSPNNINHSASMALMESTPWSFYVDDPNSKIYVNLPEPPSTYEMEIAEREIGVRLRAEGSIKGLTVQRVADRVHHSGSAALLSEGTNGQTLENVRVRHGSHYGLRVFESDVDLTDVDLSDNGVQGVSSHRGMDQTYLRVTAKRCNFRGGLWGGYTGWSPGNKHSRTRRLQIYDSHFDENYSRGLWFDIDVSDILVQDTTMNNNWRHGTYFEFASGPGIYRRCEVKNNGNATFSGDGVQINADNLMLDDCVIEGNERDSIDVTGSMDRTFTAWQDATQTLWDGPTISGLPTQSQTYNPRSHNIGWKSCLVVVSHEFSDNRWCVRSRITDDQEIVDNFGVIENNHYWSSLAATRMSRFGATNRNLADWQTYTGKDSGSVFQAP